MAARQDHGASIGDDELYEKVRDQGASKKKAAGSRTRPPTTHGAR